MASERGNPKQTPLSVIDRDGTGEDRPVQEGSSVDERETTVTQLRETLKSLKAQVEQLSQSVAGISEKAGKTVVGGVTAGKDAAVSTVESHPFFAIAAASAVAFLLGRMSVTPERGVAERAYDRLHDMALRLEPRISDAVRSRMR